MKFKACAIRYLKNGEYDSFANKYTWPEPPTVPTIDVRCLRTEAGCKSWLKTSKYADELSAITRGDDVYELVHLTLEVVE